MSEKITYKQAIAELAAITKVALDALEDEMTASAGRISELEQQNAEMLAMLKEIADGGRFTEAEVRALIRKVEGRKGRVMKPISVQSKGSKLVWEQRFILERDRAARLAWIDAEIEKLNKERQAVLELPGK